MSRENCPRLRSFWRRPPKLTKSTRRWNTTSGPKSVSGAAKPVFPRLRETALHWIRAGPRRTQRPKFRGPMTDQPDRPRLPPSREMLRAGWPQHYILAGQTPMAGHRAHSSRSARLCTCSWPECGWWCRRHAGARQRAHGRKRPDHGRDSASRLGSRSIPVWRGHRTRAEPIQRLAGPTFCLFSTSLDQTKTDRP
jgi:hypothetical protein